MNALEVRDISLSFGGLQALNGVNFAVGNGEIRGVIGPNGAGKTSLVNVITGQVRPSGGQVSVNGKRIDGMPPHEIAEMGIRRTFQTTKSFAGMTVLENVMTGLHGHARASFIQAALALNTVRKEERALAQAARESLQFVGMLAFENRIVSHLSFGQQRLVEIARALVSQPTLLLLDEPAVGLNVKRIDELDILLRRIRDERGVAIVMVEHVLRLVMEVCDSITVLSSGEVIADGSPSQVTQDKRVLEAYLGRARNAQRQSA